MKHRKGFSLLEILVVIVIIAMLATFGHQAFLSYTLRAKITAAMHVLDEYQANAMSQFDRNGTVDPYYVLFSVGNTSGLVSGSPGGTSAEKSLSLKYVASITANTGTSGSDTYILLGVGMVHDHYFVSGADHIYMAGLIASNGVITWSCGISASNSDNIATEYLPNTCLSSLP